MSMQSGTPVQRIFVDMATTNVGTTYVQLDAALDKNTTHMQLYNSTSNVFVIGYGASTAEADFVYINPGLTQYMPCHLPGNVRLSVKRVDGTASISSGILTITAFG